MQITAVKYPTYLQITWNWCGPIRLYNISFSLATSV